MRVSPTTDSVPGRIAWLLEKLWRGNQAEMSRDIGIPQGTLSNILRGKREAGAKVVHAIAAHPLVSLRWLRSGEGEPLVVSTTDHDKEVVPRATTLLPGLPSDNRHLLVNFWVEVPASFCRPSVYAIEAAACGPILFDRSEALLPNDYLVIEADSSAWLKAPPVLNRRLCVVLKGPRTLTWLGRVTCSAQQGRSGKTKSVLFANAPPTVVSSSRKEYGKERRPIQLDPLPKVELTDAPKEAQQIDIAQVVGVVVYLARVP